MNTLRTSKITIVFMNINFYSAVEPNDQMAVLNELRSLRTEMKQREENSQKLIQMLTEEVIALRHEVRQLKSLSNTDAELNLLPKLPFYSITELKEFDEKLMVDDSMKSQFVSI